MQLTRDNLKKELQGIDGARLLIEKSWWAGLKKVETPFVCLLEDDCILSPGYISINLNLMTQASTGVGNYRGGGYTKLAMLASAVGLNRFSELFYGYYAFGKEVVCDVEAYDSEPYHIQIGFVPGAIMRYVSIKDAEVNWDDSNLIRLSTLVSSFLWETNRRVKLNPNTVYVSTNEELEDIFEYRLPEKVATLFKRENI